MNKYILIAFAVMGMAFYELSGGADFEPGSNSLVIFAEPKPIQSEPQPVPEVVARAETGSVGLTDIAPTRALIEPVVPIAEPVITPVALAADGDVQAQDTVPVGVQETVSVSQPQPDFRFVEGDRVNLRGGPGTTYAVVGKLFRNDMVEILADEGNGWLHLRDTVTGDEGWIADWLVTAAN
jgi:hypothetical protein